MRPLALTFLALALGCGEGSGASPLRAEKRGALMGGVPAPAASFTLLLRIDRGEMTQTCSATRIGTRTLLTAAHCVDGVAAESISVNDAPVVETLDGGDWERVDAVVVHPRFVAGAPSLDHDLAALRLVTPKASGHAQRNRRPLQGVAGRPLRLVGYGMTEADGGEVPLVRSELLLEFRAVSDTRISVGDQVSRGICGGDSGGPSLHTFEDGVERVVGLHSYTLAPTCTDGADVRVDAYWREVDGWLAAWEPPTCEEDGRCVPDCPEADVDCACLADGVCAVGPCGAPDPDCGGDGAPCEEDAQCEGGLCVSDASGEGHCSRVCRFELECLLAWSCREGVCAPPGNAAVGGGCDGQTVCPSPTACHPLTGACEARCRNDEDCGERSACLMLDADEGVCRLDPSRAPAQPPSGCGAAATPGSAALTLLSLLALLRVSRYQSRSLAPRSTSCRSVAPSSSLSPLSSRPPVASSRTFPTR